MINFHENFNPMLRVGHAVRVHACFGGGRTVVSAVRESNELFPLERSNILKLYRRLMRGEKGLCVIKIPFFVYKYGDRLTTTRKKLTYIVAYLACRYDSTPMRMNSDLVWKRIKSAMAAYSGRQVGFKFFIERKWPVGISKYRKMRKSKMSYSDYDFFRKYEGMVEFFVHLQESSFYNLTQSAKEAYEISEGGKWPVLANFMIVYLLFTRVPITCG